MTSDLQLWKVSIPIVERAIAAINGRAPSNVISGVVSPLMNRIVNGIQAMNKLGLHENEYFGHEGAVILRGCYDAYVQAAYVLSDALAAESRAQLYLDYYEVERHLMLERVSKSTTSLKQHILQSPLRSQNEPLVDAAFRRVASKYRDRNQKLRKTWFQGSLRDLASAIGLVDEYDWVIAGLHGSVHSGPFVMRNGPHIIPQHMVFFAMSLVFRLLGRLAHCYGITFQDTEITEAIASFENGIVR